MLTAGCEDLTARAERSARTAGFRTTVVAGARYQHEIFERRSPSDENLYVFVEGDGAPWSAGGTRISRDPTPRRPLGLALALRTPGTVLYLGRPCYFAARTDSACTTSLWTSERYSAAVVESLAAVVNRYTTTNTPRRVVLVGYSGGGTLVALMTSRITVPTAIVVIAGNLDVGAWTEWHGYRPLVGSLNPATQAPLNSTLPQWYLVGDRDENVPERINHRYLDHVNPARIWRFPDFDHVCCWVDEWPRVLSRIQTTIGDHAP